MGRPKKEWFAEYLSVGMGLRYGGRYGGHISGLLEHDRRVVTMKMTTHTMRQLAESLMRYADEIDAANAARKKMGK